MSLLLTYLSRKALIAENLQSMGVNSANSNNGLTTLAGKILNIEPSVSGLNIETSINLRSSTNTSFVGQSITFEAEVIVTYDDETATNVDLSGVLTGATIIFKNGDNTLGTGITDANGIATYTCAFNTVGNHFITATFEGTDNFVSCTSSSINVSTNYNMTISSNKSILSYAHNDTATINCLLSDGLGGKSGETLSYEILDTDDNLIDSGSDITNSSGEVNFTYNSSGIGDITIVVYYSNSLQKEINIEDCLFYDDASIDNRSMYTIYDQYGNTNVGTFSYANNQYCHSWSGSYAVLLLIESLGKLSNCEIEVTGKPTSTVFSGTVGIGLQMSGSNSYGIIYYTNQSTRRVKYPWSDSYSAYYNNALEDAGDGYYSLKIYKVGNTITLAKTNESFTITGDTHYVGIMKGTSTNCFKKLKIKALSD